MGDDAVYGGVPLGHEHAQVVQVPVARVDARKVGEPVQARQIAHAAAFLPVIPVCNADTRRSDMLCTRMLVSPPLAIPSQRPTTVQ